MTAEEKVKKISAIIEEYNQNQDDDNYQDINYLIQDIEVVLRPDVEVGQEGVCEQCQKEMGEVVIDPFNADINGKDIEMCLCTDCYNERVMDI